MVVVRRFFFFFLLLRINSIVNSHCYYYRLSLSFLLFRRRESVCSVEMAVGVEEHVFELANDYLLNENGMLKGK